MFSRILDRSLLLQVYCELTRTMCSSNSGSTSLFGSQTGGFIFGGTSTGMFGTQASSPTGASPVIGPSSTPAFGSSSSPAFGASSSSFGGSSMFGVSLPFGATNTLTFHSTSTPLFAHTCSGCGFCCTSVVGSNTQAFGASNTPLFGSPFVFLSSPEFSQSTSTFGAQSSLFGGQSSFGGQHEGSRVTPCAHTYGVDIFGTQPAVKLESISAMCAYKNKCHEELRWEYHQLENKGRINNRQQSNTFSFGGQRCGSRVTSYAQTNETYSDSVTENGIQPAGKLESISAMLAYKGKSHEELRWEDYQLRDKGGHFSSSTSTIGHTSSPFGHAAPSIGQSTPAFGQSNTFGGNLFSSTPSLLSTSSMGFNLITPSFSVPFQSTQPTQNPGGFGQLFTSQSTTFAQPQSFTNPFGTLPVMRQISVGRVGTAPSIQYGISSLLVVDKPAPMRISSVLTNDSSFLILEIQNRLLLKFCEQIDVFGLSLDLDFERIKF